VYLCLPQINEQDANYILEFIYSTKVILPNMHLASFLEAASILQIKGICNWKETIQTNSNFNTFHEVNRNEKIEFNNSKMMTQIYSDSVELKKEQIDTESNLDINKIKVAIESSYNSNETCYQQSKSIMKIDKIIKKESKVAKSSTINKNGISNLKSAKSLNNKDTKPENSEASNAVYKEWKSAFSSKVLTPNGDTFNCHQCSEVKSFTLDSSLRRHYRQAHEIPCKCCQLPFYDDNALKLHMVEKHEFRCTICDKTFTLKSSLRRHHDEAHGNIAI